MLRQAFGLAVRHEVLVRNSMESIARITRPQADPTALTAPEVTAIRLAIRAWERGSGSSGPSPDGQLGAIVEVMLGTSARIGAVFAIRRRDIDATVAPPTIRLAGTIVCPTGAPPERQDHPKTQTARRTVAAESGSVPRSGRCGRVHCLIRSENDCGCTLVPMTTAIATEVGAILGPDLGWLVPIAVVLVVARFPMLRRGPNSSGRDGWRGFKYTPRRTVLARAGDRCEGAAFLAWGRCTSPAVEVDHVFPWSRGGPTVVSNGQALCSGHNRSKGAMNPPWWYVLSLERRRRGYFPEGTDVRVFAVMGVEDAAARAVAASTRSKARIGGRRSAGSLSRHR